jgi:uncharacterized RDD family membrane protein YckC
MFTVDQYRARYARASNDELLELLGIPAERLTLEARQALGEESARRALDPSNPPAVVTVEPARVQRLTYPKAPLGGRLAAYVVDFLITMGPAIMASVFAFVFHLGAQSQTTNLINMIASFSWAIYYGFTKDSRTNGQSIGKKLFSLMVVNVDTGKPCSLGPSIGRTIVHAILNGIPFIGWLIEPIAVLTTADGRRLGDRLASTQVIRLSAYEATARELEPPDSSVHAQG